MVQEEQRLMSRCTEELAMLRVAIPLEVSWLFSHVVVGEGVRESLEKQVELVVQLLVAGQGPVEGDVLCRGKRDLPSQAYSGAKG